jgi:phosphoglycerol transferase MdoB-like AlkP superfamily enzyme
VQTGIRVSEWCATGLLFASLVLMRHELVNNLDISYLRALQTGLPYGLTYDLAVSLASLALAKLSFAALRLPHTLVWGIAAIDVWALSLSNVLYFRFFGSPLHFWIVQFHFDDLVYIDTGAESLFISWPLVVSAVCVTASILVAVIFRERTGDLDPSQPAEASATSDRRSAATSALATLAAAVTIWLIPVLLFPLYAQSVFAAPSESDSILSDQIYGVWFKELLASQHSEGEAESAKTLAAFRDYPGHSADSVDSPLSSTWPLVSRMEPAASDSRELRRDLGLPEEGKINFIVLLLESVRAFEWLHPDISPKVFPRMNLALKEHGISFMQAYTSASGAGTTVRGQFSTLCSLLPVMGGPATMLAHTDLNVRCIQDLLSDNEYTVAWISPLPKAFHNSEIFESRHGVSVFMDEDYFRSKGISERIGDWGLADDPSLQETLVALEKLGDEDRPFLATVVTTSTHYPYSVIPEGPVPSELLEATEGMRDYQGYLSHLSYADSALANFFDEFKKSSIADNTVILMLGDHGLFLPPHIPLDPFQARELRFRISMAIMTKNMKRAGVRNYPVHQIDVAPTIARIAGLKGDVTWIGKGLLTGSGSPWVFQERSRLNYRTRERGCYTLPGEVEVQCVELDDSKDPLLDSLVVRVAEDVEQTDFFRQVAEASKRVIAFNLVAPEAPAR